MMASVPLDKIERIVWSESVYSMREFVGAYGQDLPVISKVTSGYSGYDDDIHQIGSGDLYWIFGIHRQKRLVARREGDTNYLSIPVEYPIKVHILNDDGKSVGGLITVRDVVADIKTKSGPTRIMFENNCKVSLQVEADLESTARLGMLTVQQTYEEKYLLAYAISNDAIFPKTHGIPVYLPIELVTGQSLDRESAKDFKRWMGKVTAITNTFKRAQIATCQEIILFDKWPSGGDYEYVRPYRFDKWKNRVIKNENPYGPHPSAVPARPRQSTNKRSSISVPMFVDRLWGPDGPLLSSGTSVNPPETTASRSPDFPEANRHLKSLHSPVSGGLSDMPNRKQLLASAVSENRNSKNRSLPPLSPLPPLPPLPPVPVTAVSGAGTEASYEKLVTASALSSSKLRVYKSLSEVPVQLDVDHLTVEEVLDCLRLMKLDQHLDAFRSKQVDGGMLLSMTKEILVEDFQFKQFDAMQLMMFAKSGWRPR